MWGLITAAPAFWGFCGAFMYAAQRLFLCIRANTCSGTICIMEFATALVIGVMAAAAFTPFASATLHRTADSDMVAVATIIGLLANRVAPELVKVLGDSGVQFIARHLMPKDKVDD